MSSDPESGRSPYPLKAVEALFAGALDRPEGRVRDQWLHHAAGGDQGLLAEVAELLAAHETSRGFLEDGALLNQSAAEPLVPDHEALIDAQIGTKLGPYEVVALLGEGGFGTVFKAVQTSPVKREVALKVIKLGMDTRQVIARFEAERQALAMLDHPSIARVLDAGATDNGRPYFVMDLAYGKDLTKFCDEERLTLRMRLGVLLDLCSAVQHAHQRGIIHRDLKPSNVLVSRREDGGAVVPKVIDFGIAKATGEDVAEGTLFTEQGQIIGTPIYMSPEQATGNAAIDTRADVYSLGVILYELLAGVTPLSTDDLRAQSGDLARFLQDFEPTAPSERFASLGDRKSKIAAARDASVPEVLGAIRGDLDHIALCALETDRDRRYESAAALSRDIQRYLENRPIEASPPSTIYRTKKFVRRHRVAVMAGAAVIAASLTGGAIAIDSLRSKRDMGQALLGVLRTATDVTAADDGAASAESVEEQINRTYGADAPIMVDALAMLADRLDRQGAVSEAVGVRARSLQAAVQIHGDDGRETNLARAALGRQLSRLGERGKAEAQLRRAVAADAKTSPPGTPAFNAARLELARLCLDNDELAEAEELALVADQIARTDATEDRRLRTEALEMLVQARVRAGNSDGARSAWLSLLEIYAQLLPEASLFVPRKRLEFSRWLLSVGESDGAAKEAQAVLAQLEAQTSPPLDLLLAAVRALDQAALDAPEAVPTEEARASFFREIELVAATSGRESSAFMDTLRVSADRFEQLGDPGTALKLRCDRFKILRRKVAGTTELARATLLRILADELGLKAELICRRDGLDAAAYYAASEAVTLALGESPNDPFLLEVEMVLSVRVGLYVNVFGLMDNFRESTDLKGDHPLLLALEAIVFSKQASGAARARAKLARATELAREPQFVGLQRLDETLSWAQRTLDGVAGTTLDAGK